MNKKINIDGVDYTIDLEKAKKLGLINPSYTKKVGQRFYDENGDEHILAATETGKVNLICLTSGLRIHVESIAVESISNINEDEWNKIGWPFFKLID
jgi:hypothetical protein